MENARVCGVMINDDKCLAKVYAFDNEDGTHNLIYDNSPFGIVDMFGFKEAKIKAIGSVGGSVSSTETSCVFDNVAEMIRDRVRGDYMGAIYLEDGVLLVKSLYPFEAVKQGHKIDGKETEYTDYVDVADVDDDSDYFDFIAEFFELI